MRSVSYTHLDVYKRQLSGLGWLTLLPGNLLGTWAVQSLLWQSHLTLGAMTLIATALCVGINAAVWFLVIKGIKVLRLSLIHI